MKKFTFLFLMLFGVIGFAQQATLKNSGVANPVHHSPQQKAKAVVPSANRAAEAGIKNLGQRNPTFTNDHKNKSAQNDILPLEKSLFGTSGFSTSGVKGKVSSNPVAGTVSLQGIGYKPDAPVVITHSTSQNIVANNSVTCSAGGITSENSFFRAFDLSADFGITDDFTVSSAEFGVENSNGPTNLTINVYSTSAGFPAGYPGNAILQGTASYVSGAADTGLVVSVPITATIPAGDIMIYELKVNANGTTSWYPGSNLAPETGTSYLMAGGCSISVPTSTTGIGFPDMHLVMNIVGEEGTGGGGGPFPSPYCAVPFSFIEPITLVDVAGISNVSDATSTVAHEDFTAISGDMEEGMSYLIALEGNTSGSSYTNSFTVFIDWNHDGVLDNDTERYEIGTIQGSTGTDGIQATGTIDVPAGVTGGATRMRVIKRYQANYATDSCVPGSGFGQAEDYTIDVTAAGGGGGQVYCSPEGTNSNRFIDNFSTTGGSENISNMGSGFSNEGYGDFYDTHTVTQEQGETVEFSVDIEGGTAGFRVWVDWNQDGVFDETQEVAYASSGYQNSQTGSITVPADALEGDTRMRIVSHWLSQTGDVDPCKTGFTYGEFEDYKFTVESGTGGGGGVACEQEHPFGASAAGASGSSVDSNYKTAADIVVVAGEDFTLNTIEVPFLTYAPNDPPTTADVVYYANAGGLPGAMIGSETVVPTILSSGPWANPVADQYMTSLALTPFTFEGDASSDTTYWIEISMGTATNQGTVLWEYSDDIPVEGLAYAKYDGVAGTWAIDDPTLEVIYNFSGDCEPMGGGGGAPCSQADVSNGFENGQGDTNNTVEVADEIIVPADTNFEVDKLTVNLINNGGFNTIEVGFYEDAGGKPGTMVGSIMTVTPTSSTVIGTAFGRDVNEIVMDFATPIVLPGTAGNETIYWIGIETPDVVDPTSDAFWETTSIENSGTDYRVHYDIADQGWTATDPADGMWNTVYNVSGNCAPMGAGGTCSKPTNLAVSNIAPTSADLSWDAESNASSGYIWYVFEADADPITATPVATGTTATGTTTATATGLSSGLSYDFYVVADCASDGISNLAGPVTFVTVPSCGGKFYDTGGPTANYGNNENVTTVIAPEVSTDYVTVTFTAFDVESGWDALYVYDGPDASSPIISSGNPATNSGFPAGGYYGTTIPGPFSSTHPSGKLTFVFRSESSVNKAGWEADVTCTPTPPPNDMIVNSIDVDEVGFPYTDAAVNMPGATTEDGNPNGCDLTGANGVWYNFVSEGDGQANATIVTPGGASSVTFYTAPNENAVETDLTLVPAQTNQCGPGTTASIYTSAGQAYYVFVLNTAAITDIVIDGTNLGVADNTIDGFSYYPNPTSDILNLKSIDNIESVSLYNLLGQRVIDTRINATTSQVDVSGLSIGTYLMKVTVNGKMATYRVLKQ